MKIYSYIMTDDTGFAPNPFGGVCTLACCKPEIRRLADKGDMVIGIRGRKLFNKIAAQQNIHHINDKDIFKIIYIMTVSDKKPFQDYFKDSRFKSKIPSKVNNVSKCGDNIYKPQEQIKSLEDFIQLPSTHSNDDLEDKDTKNHDLGGVQLKNNNVLIADNYYYFGSSAIDTNAIDFLYKYPSGHLLSRKHKVTGNPDDIVKVLAFIKAKTIKKGILGKPHEWQQNDNTWRVQKCI